MYQGQQFLNLMLIVHLRSAFYRSKLAIDADKFAIIIIGLVTCSLDTWNCRFRQVHNSRPTSSAGAPSTTFSRASAIASGASRIGSAPE